MTAASRTAASTPVADAAPVDAAPAAANKSRPAGFLELTKPRITVLLLVTCVAAMVCAARGLPDLTVLFVGALGLALSSAGASALNHVIDRDIDALMHRTAQRPVVTGLVSPVEGAIFGLGLMALSAALLWTFVNPLSALLAAGGGAFYVVGYTLVLKRRTVQNIVIGGAAGAMPPVVGWAAVTGEVSALAIAMFAIIFMWTPPHFWALALLIREEYERASVPMLPVVAGERATTAQIWWYSIGLVVVSLVPVALGDLGVVYGVAALALGGKLLGAAYQLRKRADTLAAGEVLVTPGSAGHAAARAMFLFSMLYLALIFAAAVVDRAAFFYPLV